MLRIIRGFITAACATVTLLASACGQTGTEPVPPPPPPPVQETLSVKVQAPASVLQDVSLYPNASVSVAVDATSNKGSVTTACTLDGKPVPCAGNINMTLGAHSFVAVATSIATLASRTDSTTIVVLPLQIVGHVYVRTMTGEHCPSGAYVVAGDVGSIQDSTLVNSSTCAYTLNTRYAGTPNTRIVVPGDANSMGMLAHVDQKYYGRLDMVTMEKNLTIPLGQFAGQTKVVNLDLPYLVSGDGYSSFFWRYRPTSTSPWQYTVGNFPSYPVSEQFCRNLSNQSITAKDSVGYAALMVQFHQVFGQELFRQDASTNVCVTGIGRQLYADNTSGSIPGGDTRNRFARDFQKSFVNFATELAIVSQYTVHHESIHSLGFGHVPAPRNGGWSSVMCAGCTNNDPGSGTITSDDVFWFYVMQAMANGQRLHNTVFGLPQVHQYYRVSHKESEEIVLVYEPY